MQDFGKFILWNCLYLELPISGMWLIVYKMMMLYVVKNEIHLIEKCNVYWHPSQTRVLVDWYLNKLPFAWCLNIMRCQFTIGGTYLFMVSFKFQAAILFIEPTKLISGRAYEENIEQY
jgi:hypothetical protein